MSKYKCSECGEEFNITSESRFCLFCQSKIEHGITLDCDNPLDDVVDRLEKKYNIAGLKLKDFCNKLDTKI
jgi:transposase-like protein